MNDMICDFYAKVDIDPDAVDRMIAAVKTAKPRRALNRYAAAAACAAALVIGFFSVFLFLGPAPVRTIPSYDIITKISGAVTGDDALLSHDGFAVAIESAYSNGETIYVALFGEYNRWEWDYDSAPDTLRYRFAENDGSFFTVNGRAAELITPEIKLTKDGGLFKGVVELKTDEASSASRLEMQIPSFEVYSESKPVKTISADFSMAGCVTRVYTDNEDALLRGENLLYIQNIVQFPRGTIGDYSCGVSVQYHVPYDLLGEGKDIQAKVFNEDGGEIPMTDFLQYGDSDGGGMLMYSSFDFPESRNIRVALYDANAESDADPIQEYDVLLNDLSISLAFED